MIGLLSERRDKMRIKERLYILMGVLAFGSLWGLMEATLGGVLANFPRHGAVMANIGFVLMAAAVALYRRPGLLPWIGVVAASFKLLTVPLFHVPPFARMVINPMVSIILEALAFSLAIALLRRWYPRSQLAQAGAGALGMYLGYLGIGLAFLYLTRRGPANLVLWQFVLSRGSFAALLALAAVPLGSWLGRPLCRLERLAEQDAGAIACILLCLLGGVLGTLKLG
jgi:hypothetical protein